MARKSLAFRDWIIAGGYERAKWVVAYMERKGAIPPEWRGRKNEIAFNLLEGMEPLSCDGVAFVRLKSAWGAYKSRKARQSAHGGVEQLTIRGRPGLRNRFRGLMQDIDATPEDALELLIWDVREFKKKLQQDEHKELHKQITQLKSARRRKVDPIETGLLARRLADELTALKHVAEARLMELCRYHIVHGGLQPLTVDEEKQAMALYQQKSSVLSALEEADQDSLKADDLDIANE